MPDRALIGAASWWRWVVQPWRSPALVLALVGALGLPGLALASGPMFERSASDAIATDLAGELEPGPAGLVVDTVVSMREPELGRLDQLVTARLDAIEPLEPAVRTAYSELLAAAPPGVEPRGKRARILVRDGAAEAVELVAGTRAPGQVLIPANQAAELGVGPGDQLLVGAGVPVTVSGVYRDLWDTTPDPYWATAPVEVVPRFQRVFSAPQFELVIADATVLAALAPPGHVRWDAALVQRPTSWDDMRRINAAYRSLGEALVRPGELNDAYRAAAIDPEAPPFTFTALDAAQASAQALIEELHRPVTTTTFGGAAAGLLVSGLGAVVLVRRQRRDHRLMAADGDAAWRFVGRSLAQGVLPAVAGGVVGVAGAWLLIRWLGPSGAAALEVVPWGRVLAAGAIALGVCSIATGVLAVRLTDALDARVGGIGPTALWLLVGTVVAMWVAVAQDDRRGVDALVVAFPLVGIVAGVLLAVLGLRYALRALRRTGGRLPTPLFLAWRALTASEEGALGLTAAMGVASGLAVLSAGFVGSIDTAIDLKAVTLVGSTSRLDTIDRIDPLVLPPSSTIVLDLDTTIDGRSVQVLAIDPATFADAVRWPDAFGPSVEEVLDDLADPDVIEAGLVPAVAVDGHVVSTRSSFGLQRSFGYDLVGDVRSFPLAAETNATIVIRADVLDEIARARWEVDQVEAMTPTERLAAEALAKDGEGDGAPPPIPYRSPLETYGNAVVSRQPAAVLADLAVSEGWRAPEVRSFDDVTGDVTNRSTRWAFDHLGILAVVGAVVALAALALQLAERRAQRQLSAVMTEQLGIGRAVNVAAAIVEVVGLVIVAVAAGVAAALVTARHVFPSFEPDPRLPPSVGLTVRAGDVALLLGGTVVAVAVIAALAQWRASSASRAAVLRG